MRRYRNLIRASKQDGRLETKGGDRDKKRIRVRTFGQSRPALSIVPYGLESNPPDDTFAVLYQQEGYEAALLAILTDLEKRRDLEENEVAFGAPESSTRIKARPDGTITIIINDSDGGDFLARFNELKSGFDELKNDYNNFVSTTYNAHTHISAPSGSPTATPLPTGSATSASIDAAKIEEVEVP